MNTNPAYQPLYDQARDLQFKFRDFTGDSEHPQVRALHQEVDHLMNDIESNKNPRDLESRIKTIQHQVQQAQHSGNDVMNYQHADFMYDNYERMRQQVRQLDNF